jgi:hypothetical protein
LTSIVQTHNTYHENCTITRTHYNTKQTLNPSQNPYEKRIKKRERERKRMQMLAAAAAGSQYIKEERKKKKKKKMKERG